jgi:hypothetical protein
VGTGAGAAEASGAGAGTGAAAAAATSGAGAKIAFRFVVTDMLRKRPSAGLPCVTESRRSFENQAPVEI